MGDKMGKSKVAKFGVDLSRINNILEGDDSFKYQMLGRWQQDMDYYFGHGRRSENQLWAQDFDTLIEYMKAVWESLGEKPEWLSMEDIEEYARHKDMPGWYHGTNGWEEKPWWAYWEHGEDDGDVFKSASNIHDMMSQIRANNNSLVKSRVDLGIAKRTLRSVGNDYPLDYDRVSNEMLQYIIDSKKPNGDYALDEYGGYDKWMEDNYIIDYVDDEGYDDYDPKLIDMLENKFISHREKQEHDLMDKVLDLEYNDLVSFKGYGEYYVKSTNGNDTYVGCKIWAGPDKDDDRGWYFDASDFDGVVEHSNSGEHIFGW